VPGRCRPGRETEKAAGHTGLTDELGLATVEDRVSVPDWHATILHLLGLHNDQLFYEMDGLRERLTGVNEAHVVRGILS